MDMRLEVNRVYLVLDKKKRRREVHISHLKKDMVCVCMGVTGGGFWETCTEFAKSDPKAIGWFKGSFWSGKNYIYDEPPNALLANEEIRKAENERRSAVEAMNKSDNACRDAEEVIEIILKSAVRDGANQQWVIKDRDLFTNDVRGRARERMPQ